MIRKTLPVLLLLGLSMMPILAQPTPTPLPIIIPTNTLAATETPVATEVPPSFTPTDQGPAQILVPADSGAINARSEADIDSFVLGQIYPGETYQVTGRFFRWIQFRYEPAPSGLAYVYDELVELIGDTSQIPDLSVVEQPTLDLSGGDATGTFEALLLTPGFDITLTASVREIEAPSGDLNASGGEVIMPTFTYPPNIVAQAPTAGAVSGAAPATLRTEQTAEAEGMAPMVPIVIFGALGIIGLMLGALQR